MRDATASCAPVDLGRAPSTIVAAGSPGSGPRRCRRRRGLRRRRPDEREGLPAGQVRPSGARARRNIDYNGRFCMTSAAAAANRAFGLDRGLPFPLTDLAGADAVLLLGSNLAETMPPAVAAPRERPGARRPDRRRPAPQRHGGAHRGRAGLHLQPVPGTDLAVLLGLAARRASPRGWPTRPTSRRGPPAGTRSAGRSPRGGPSGPSRSPASRPRRCARRARLLAAASPSPGRARRVRPHRPRRRAARQGTDTVTAAINLALALGLPGRDGSGYGAITGQGNGQGGREHGQKSDQLPGYRKIDDPAARAHVAGVWGVDPDEPARPGQAGGRAARLPGHCRRAARPARARRQPRGQRPGRDARSRNGCAALDLLVVCDFVPSETALLADVVLPVTQWAEEEGTMTSLEGRVIRRRKAVDPPGGVRSELRIWPSWRAGSTPRASGPPSRPRSSTSWPAPAPAAAPTTAGSATPGSTPGEALYWPCPAPADGTMHPGTPRLFLDRFATPDGRARMVVAVDHRGPAEDLRPGHPLYLVTGRLLQHYQSGAQTRRVAELVGGRARALRASCTRHWPPASASRTATRSASPPPRRASRPGPADRRTSGRTRSSCRSTGAGRAASTGVTNRRDRPHLRDAGVQGLRGRATPAVVTVPSAPRRTPLRHDRSVA